MTTANGELEHKVAELETAHDDLDNLFSGTQVATLFLDRSMCITRFTPAIKDLLSLIASNIGRSLADSVYLSARLKRLLGFEDDQLANSLGAWQERIVQEDRAAFADVAQRQSDCGTARVKIGEEVGEQLDIIPMQVRVIRTPRPRYACPQSETAPVVASAPPQVLPRSQFSTGLLAMLLTVKYANGLPLNRFAQVLERHGITVPRQSLARAVIQAARVLQPVHNLTRDALLDGPVIHMGEMPVQVLKEPDKPPASQSYMGVQRGGPPDRPVIVYDYDPSRSGAVPETLLEGWQGYLMTDGYDGYNAEAAREGNAIRPFVVGRKAWLFADTPAGTHASAVIYSLIETVKANGMEPYTWLKRVLTDLPAAQTVEAIEALSPWNLHAHDLAMELAD